MTRPADPRATYIAIAASAFAAQGYHGASLATLAREAGVSKQALLHFFGTKERLYGAVLTDLAARLCADIEAAADLDPAQHLLSYFQNFHAASAAKPEDIRLVVRALLDSDPKARTWPMKPYLERLAALAAATPGGQGRTEAQIMAWLSQMIGRTEYLAISTPAVAGMFGQDMASEITAESATMVSAEVRRFCAGTNTG